MATNVTQRITGATDVAVNSGATGGGGQQGRCRLDVSDEAVTMTMFGGDSAEPTRTFALRDVRRT